MNSTVKKLFLLDILFLIFVLISFFFLNLDSTIFYLVLGLFAGFTFFILFLLISLFFKKILFVHKKNYPIKIGSLIYTIGFVLSLAVVVIVFNSSLYIQALLGNDLFLTLDVKEDSFSVLNGQSFSINSESSIIANPFCHADCNISLIDLNSGEIVSSDLISLYVSSSFDKDFFIILNESTFGYSFYRISLICSSVESLFCYTTTNYTKHASKIIFVEHNLNEVQGKLLKDYQKKISSLYSEQNRLYSNIDLLKRIVLESSSLDLNSFNSRIYSLSSRINSENLSKILEHYSNQDFDLMESSINLENVSLYNHNKEFIALNNSIYSDIYLYNRLLENLTEILSNVSSLDLENYSNLSSNLELDNYISEFLDYSDIETKEEIYKNISLLLESSFISYPLETLSFDFLNFSNLSSYTVVNSPNFSDLSPMCCLFGSCSLCSKANSSLNYPVILLHGHSFNEKVSAFASLEIFDSLQENLEKDGYLNVGSFFYSGYDNYSYNTFGKISIPISIKASYYFDVFSSDSGTSLLETKTDNIDTYAIRLKEIIENIKYITGKDKVIIVTHSMGGLVARRYIQIFGDSNVEKLIMVASPNHGVDGFVTSYCTLFGTEDECDNMNSDSLFLNKLNQQTSLNIPVYNIIGEGCFWENSIGDGIVKNESAYLSFAENYYVNGTCDGFDYFHSNILDIKKYPEVYNIINKTLKE